MYQVVQFTRGCTAAEIIEDNISEENKDEKAREVAEFNIENATQLYYRGLYKKD